MGREDKSKVIYTAAWYADQAEVSNEQVHNFFKALGWKSTWAPWYKRAWWWLKAIGRRVVRLGV